MAGRPEDPERLCLRCSRPRREHGEGKSCPVGGGTLRVTQQAPSRASGSFSREELAAGLAVFALVAGIDRRTGRSR